MPWAGLFSVQQVQAPGIMTGPFDIMNSPNAHCAVAESTKSYYVVQFLGMHVFQKVKFTFGG